MISVFPLTDQEDGEETEEQPSTSSQQEESMEMEPEQIEASPQKSPARRGRPPKQAIKVESPKGKSPMKSVEESPQRRGAIADTVKKMKSVLSPPKLSKEDDEAHVQVCICKSYFIWLIVY